MIGLTGKQIQDLKDRFVVCCEEGEDFGPGVPEDMVQALIYAVEKEVLQGVKEGKYEQARMESGC